MPDLTLGISFDHFRKGKSMASTVTINGVSISTKGKSIGISNGRVKVDGKDVTPDTSDAKEITINVVGDVGQISSDVADINVEGSAGSIQSHNGEITCGNVKGNVSSHNGDIKCGSVAGNATTYNGDIR